MKDKDLNPSLASKSMVRRGVLLFAMQGIVALGWQLECNFYK